MSVSRRRPLRPRRAATTRARLRICRCRGGQVLMDPVGFSAPWRWTYQIAYEWGALVKALIVQRSC